ncbi:MAG: [FeFe] hydrogenase H-cluster maturation GTPase HydF, partial [Chitinivibrionales bacterium]
MKSAPKSLRLQIGLFGRTNTGKSSFLNMVTGQDVSIVSEIQGTTTDVVEKSMELLPIGPVTFLDTAGTSDTSDLSFKRLEKTEKVFDRADIIVIITEPETWTHFEESIVKRAKDSETPVLCLINKSDLKSTSKELIDKIAGDVDSVVSVSSIDNENTESYINSFKNALIKIVPEDYLYPPPLIGDLVRPGGTAVLVVPIDLEAPKGRLILPQVQSIRDLLDNDAAALIVKERELRSALDNLKRPPDIVVCDSQVVLKMTADTPPDVRCTTFSILFARNKGDLSELTKGSAAIEGLDSNSRILIAEACSHHALEDDIGRVKIPRWLRQYTGCQLSIDHTKGRDYPENIGEYDLIIHCGSCMLTRRETIVRIEKAKQAGVSITNYGVCIS